MLPVAREISPVILEAKSASGRALSLAGTATSIIFVATNIFCRDKHNFVATRQAYFCRGKHTFVAAKDVFCRDKNYIILVAAPANDSAHLNTYAPYACDSE